MDVESVGRGCLRSRDSEEGLQRADMAGGGCDCVNLHDQFAIAESSGSSFSASSWSLGEILENEDMADVVAFVGDVKTDRWASKVALKDDVVIDGSNTVDEGGPQEPWPGVEKRYHWPLTLLSFEGAQQSCFRQESVLANGYLECVWWSVKQAVSSAEAVEKPGNGSILGRREVLACSTSLH